MRAPWLGMGALALAGLLLAVAPPVSAQTALALGELPVGVGGTQEFAANDRVNFTMPAATGGTPPYAYTLVPNAGSTSFGGRYTGLTFDADNNRIIGVPTASSTSFGYNHIVTDSASGRAENLYRFIVGNDVTDPVVTYTVPGALVVGTAVTLPPDTDDPDTLTFALDAATPLPPGLSLATDTGIISGAPTTANASTTDVTIGVTDSAGNDADVALTFPAVDAGPDTTAPVVRYTPPTTLAVGISVMLSPDTDDTDIASYAVGSVTPPPGLSLAPDTGIISGTPTTENTSTTAVTITVTDTSGNAAPVELTFPAVGPMPVGLPQPPDMSFPKAAAFTLTLPPRNDGTAPITYALTPDPLPAGLTFTAATRVLAGTPTEPDSTPLTYTATDSAATPDAVSVTFALTVTGPSLALVEDQVWEINQAVALTLPVASSGATGDVTYELTPATLPAALAGLSFTAATDPATAGYGGILSGTPTTTFAATELTYTATDEDDDAGFRIFSVQVVLPGLSFSATAPVLRFVPEEPISVTLPAAVGVGTLTYSLTPVPDGLAFDPNTRVLSGTPTMVVNQNLSYTVTDVYESTATLLISVGRRANAERLDAINRAILPKVGRVMADQAVGAIARRVEQAHGARRAGIESPRRGVGGGTAGGAASTLAGVLSAHGSALAEGTRDLRSLLDSSDFALPLNGGENSGTPASIASTMSLWGSGDYRELSDRQGAFSWDGELISAQLGVDFFLAETLLAGVAFSQSQSDMDYEDELGSGTQELDLSSVYPYMGWSAFEGRIELWATFGYGAGEVEISEDDGTSDTFSSDANMQTLGAGGRSRLLGGSGEGGLWLKGDVFQATLEVEGSDEMSELEVDINRVRLALASSRSYTLANGSLLEPSVEVGLRYDGGDGETGSALEVGAGMRHVNPALGLTLEGKFFSNSLEAYDSYREWGLQGSVKLAPRSDGRGLFFQLSSGYGAAASPEVQELWERDLEDLYARRADERRNRGMRLDARLGYGLSAAHLRRPGLLTPYSEMVFQGDTAAYHLGFLYHPTPSTELDLRWSHHDDPTPTSSAPAARPTLNLSATATF